MKLFRNKKTLIVLGLLILLTGLFAYVYIRGIPQDRPNIVFITVDALRAGNLHCYGYERETSPNIDKFAKESALFLNCFAAAPNTLWSTPTFLTGKYIWSLANVYNEYVNHRLSYKFVTLPEHLKSFGYYTAAFVNNGNYSEGSGFDQGFDSYQCYLNLAGRRSPDRPGELTADVISFLDNYKQNKPLFIWVHYLAPHAPYTPPKEYLDKFVGDKTYDNDKRILELQPDKKAWPYDSGGFIPRIVFDSENEIYTANYYVASYDAEILYNDFYIGELLNRLDDNTIVILSADHGESLGEHGIYFSHGENIYSELLHVPLIIKDKKNFLAGQRIEKTVSLLDIVPTLIKRINPVWYFFHKDYFDGVDLQSLDKQKKRKFLYAFAAEGGNKGYYSVLSLDSGYKYIRRRRRIGEFYRLPDEYTNLIDDWSPETILEKEKLIKTLDKWLEKYPIRCDSDIGGTKMSKEQEENLRSLGYIH